MSAALSYADKRTAFEIATSALLRWFGDELVNGATDDQLHAFLEKVLGIAGGSCGPGRISVSYRGSGLRIWAGWDHPNEVRDEPIFAGSQTISMAREVYGIPDPSAQQLALI